MIQAPLKDQQISALGKINFCYNTLKQYPPFGWKHDAIDENSIENTKANLAKLTPDQHQQFLFERDFYFCFNSITHALMMLLVNYLFALLIDIKNNKISIHKNHATEEITPFIENNKDLLHRLRLARNKLFAHIDLDWQTTTKNISLDEFKICIDFLNSLLGFGGYDFNKA